MYILALTAMGQPVLKKMVENETDVPSINGEYRYKAKIAASVTKVQ